VSVTIALVPGGISLWFLTIRNIGMVVSVLFVEALNLTKEFLIEELLSLESSVVNSASLSLESTVARFALLVYWLEVASGTVAESVGVTSSLACIIGGATVTESSGLVHDQLESIIASSLVKLIHRSLPDVPSGLRAPVGEDCLVGVCLGDKCFIICIYESAIFTLEEICPFIGITAKN